MEFVNEALWYKERQNNGQALLQALFDETKNSIWEKTSPDDIVLDAHVAHYYIRSSHNTYLTGDQKEGPFERSGCTHFTCGNMISRQIFHEQTLQCPHFLTCLFLSEGTISMHTLSFNVGKYLARHTDARCFQLYRSVFE